MLNRLFLLVILPWLSFSEHCKEPDTSKLQEPMMSSVHDSFYQIQPLLNTVMGLSDVPEEYVNIQIAKMQSNEKCSKLEHLARKKGGNLCPSYRVINYDVNRKPDTLLEARCSCETCFGPNSDSSLLSCQPLIYYTRVLRRFGCQNGTYFYQTMWEPLQVGCTCRFPQQRMGSDVPRTPKAPGRRNIRSIIMDKVRQSQRN